MPSRASTIREILRRRLGVDGSTAKTGAKSGDFGVLAIKPNNRRPRA